MPDSLPPDLKAMIRAKVDSGQYTCEEEVVRAALTALDRSHLEYQRKLEALRRDIQEGIESGDGGDFDVEAMIERGRKRRDAARLNQP